MVASIFLRIFSYGVPTIFIIFGLIALMGGQLSLLIFGTSSPSLLSGLLLIISGLFIFFILFRFGIH